MLFGAICHGLGSQWFLRLELAVNVQVSEATIAALSTSGEENDLSGLRKKSLLGVKGLIKSPAQGPLLPPQAKTAPVRNSEEGSF